MAVEQGGVRPWVEQGSKVTKEAAYKADACEAKAKADFYWQASEVDGERQEASSGQGQLFVSQVNELRSGDLGALLDLINQHNETYNRRTELYSNYCSEAHLDTHNQNGSDTFRVELLAHLAGNIVIKEHRLRWQQEQLQRFILPPSLL